MSVGAQRSIGGTLGFAFAAVWVMAGLEAGVVCVAAAGVGYGVARLRERGSLGSLIRRQKAVRRDLHARFAPATREARPARQSKPQQPRAVRERVPQVAAVDPITYGW